jgi:DNA-binding CsgD family transcriptional regulator
VTVIEDLSRSQLERALHVVGELGQLRDLRDYPQTVVRLVRRLIVCDHASYNAIELRSRRATIVVDPPDAIWDGGAEEFAQLGRQNPLLAHVASTRDERALVLSDFITRRALHRTELYAHVYRRIPMEYQLTMAVRSPLRTSGRPAEVVGLSLGRVRRDFSRGEQRLLETLQPHFTSTLERLHELTLMRASIVADPQHASRWLVLVDDDATVAWASTAAADGLGVDVGGPLPPALRTWLAAERARPGRCPGSAARITVGEVPFRVRLISDAYPELDALHLTPLDDPFPAQALRSLGLTRRQADVIALALRGRTAAEIAVALALSRRTVEKHFEAIYARLGVSNRSEAVVTVLREMRG